MQPPRDDAKAATLGVGALVFGFGGPYEIAEFREIYDKAIAARDVADCVTDVTSDHLAALVPAIVLDDPMAARRIGVRGQRFFSGHRSLVPGDAVAAERH